MYKGKLLTGAVLSVFMAGAYGNACAADGTSDAVYSLNPVVVTATRYEKSDAEIPAATQTFTEEQIEQTGADNLQVALQYLDGVIDAGMGPNGTSVSSMTTKNVIRGVSNGTVVMINGTPINWRTNYNLENIPTSAVERVEVVRGGGAVLYGSQATGGVINIITKKTLPNEVKVGLGNKGRQEYAVTANAGDLSIAYTYNKWGKLGYVSSSDSSIKPDKTRVPVEMKQRFFGSEKNDFLATYKLNDHADFLYNHNESASRWAYTYTGITDPDYEDMNDHPRYIRRYENDKDFLQFNFHGLDGISGHVFYNYNTLKTHGTDYYSSTGKKYAAPKAVRGQEKNKTYGYDVQIENTAWDGLIPSLQSDKADLVISSMTITDERKKLVSFAGPYYYTQQAILVLADNDDIKSVDDLADKNVAVQSGSNGPAILEEFAPKASQQENKTDEEARQALQQGRVDAYVIDNNMQQSALVREPGKYKIAGKPFGSKEPYGIGLPLDSDGVAFVNDFLKKIEDDGTWTELWQICIGDRTGDTNVPELPEIGA